MMTGSPPRSHPPASVAAMYLSAPGQSDAPQSDATQSDLTQSDLAQSDLTQSDLARTVRIDSPVDPAIDGRKRHRHPRRVRRGWSRTILCGLLFFAPWSGVCADEATTVRADVLLRGGTVIDGGQPTGDPSRVADVAIRGDEIVSVGDGETVDADWVIDCEGLVIAPGFIDLHNHSDRQVTEPATRGCVNYLTQGCTTIVTGNCGGGVTDVGDYYDQIDRRGAGVNVAHLVPHGSIRRVAMEGSKDRRPTDDELSRLRELADRGMREGAWGMSTGLIYTPGSYAETEELIEVARAVAGQGGIYVSHMRDEGPGLLRSVEETLRIGREASLPVHISHFKARGEQAWGLVRLAAEMVNEAREAGQVVTADQYPYIAASTSLDAYVLPGWSRAGSRGDLLRRLDDPDDGPKIRDYTTQALESWRGGATLQIARYEPEPGWSGRTLDRIAVDEGVDVVDLVFRIVRGGTASVVNFAMSEDDVRFIMGIPWVATASDGRSLLPSSDRPHPRSFGTFTRKLGHYAVREQVVSLEQAVFSGAGLPAEILGLTDRGLLRPGQRADVIVFDPDRVIDNATFEAPFRHSDGIVHVLVNGTPAVHDGTPTGALAGRSLRHRGGKPADKAVGKPADETP